MTQSFLRLLPGRSTGWRGVPPLILMAFLCGRGFSQEEIYDRTIRVVAATDSQTAVVLGKFAEGLQAQVQDWPEPASAPRIPDPAVRVVFTVNGTGGAEASFDSLDAVSVDTAMTDNDGIATSRQLYANGKAGEFTVAATIEGLDGNERSAQFHLKNIPGTPVLRVRESPRPAVVGGDFEGELRVLVEDTLHNPVNGILVDFIAPDTGATLVFTESAAKHRATVRSGMQGSDGIAGSGSLKAGTISGAYTIWMSISTDTGRTSVTMANVPDKPSAIDILPPFQDTAVVNTTFAESLRVRLTDRFGNPVTDQVVHFQAPRVGDSASCFFAGTQSAGAYDTTDACGLAAVSATANSKVGRYTVQASCVPPDSALKVQFTLTNIAARPAMLKFLAGAATPDQVAGRPLDTLVVQLCDAFGNVTPVPGDKVTLRLLEGSGSLRGDTVAASNGYGLYQFGNVRINLGGDGKRLGAMSRLAGVDTARTRLFSLATLANLKCSLAVAGSYRDSVAFRLQSMNLGPSDIPGAGVKIIVMLKGRLQMTGDGISAPGWSWSIVPKPEVVASGTFGQLFPASADSVKSVLLAAKIDTSRLADSSKRFMQVAASIQLNDESWKELDTVDNRCELPRLTLKVIRPGDCNNDGEVNASDLIPIALCYKDTGPKRWGQPAFVEQFLPFGWTDDISARADCNGDGLVDARDVLVLACNFERREWAGLTPDTCGQGGLRREPVRLQLLAAATALPESPARTELLNMLLEAGAAVEQLPTDWSVAQNYPNPFNGETTIRLGVPLDAGALTVTIYDVLGRRVARHWGQNVRKGWYLFQWDGKGENGRALPTGMYFYRLETPKVSPVFKMLYIK